MPTHLSVPSSTEAFLFDLDGVIIDSEREYTRIWAAIEREFPTGITDFPLKIKGTTLENILATYYPDLHTRDRVEKRLYELESQMEYHIIPGAYTLLNRLHMDGIPAALVTSSNEVKMAHLWEQHPELKNYFSTIITADRITHSKPHPEGYLLAARLLGVDPGKSVVVEDSLQGVRAGRHAGAFVIGVAGTLPADLLKEDANIVTEDLAAISISAIRKIKENEK